MTSHDPPAESIFSDPDETADVETLCVIGNHLLNKVTKDEQALFMVTLLDAPEDTEATSYHKSLTSALTILFTEALTAGDATARALYDLVAAAERATATPLAQATRRVAMNN